MSPIDNMAMELTELIAPFITGLLLVVIALWLRDIAVKVAKGVMFNMNKAFQEGDKVVLDGERALIVKIGLTQTVFGITKKGGDWD